MFYRSGHHQVLIVVGEETAVFLRRYLVADIWFPECICMYSFLLCYVMFLVL
jgi:hypothetical protein